MNDYYARRTESVNLRAKATRKRIIGYTLSPWVVMAWPINMLVTDPGWSIAITAVQYIGLTVEITLFVQAARIDKRATKLMVGAL